MTVAQKWEQRVGDALLLLDLEHGARLSSLKLGDLELLGGVGKGPIEWGCYVMAPWVGRIRHGQFTFDAHTYSLPQNMPPHAIHGTVFNTPWVQRDDTCFEADLGRHWPFPGQARQRIELFHDRLEMELSVISSGPAFPAACGWHPWFRRRLARGGEARLGFHPRAIYQRDQDGMPGALVPPTPPPWDDCFKGVQQPVTITWSDVLTLSIQADVDHWVIYNERPEAICIEPQTGPPNALNIAPRFVTPENPLRAKMTLSWS